MTWAPDKNSQTLTYPLLASQEGIYQTEFLLDRKDSVSVKIYLN